ncbi:hypothetical protein HUB98_15330 [Paenibacillus barcinonensis]|uniref:Uncharacterized protein n=1 Tax=Paenibacillus barcinonensis TaxID=198119 RepID=A0A2V4WG98_PAEBA|nr:hypothetical protein [Paenibacillus barcinonensis]PYE50875.1 hypothetical protein DFQ00_103294 [Paenibacillus barcinonensis]QKS57544.1 hypothetical protein HUB98_15330 [Paenibacillus barcinonensis]
MDKKAVHILMSTFWGSGGWKSAYSPFCGEEFEYAKRKGVMFDPISITHDEIVQRLHSMHQQPALKQQAVTAFLYSLSTKKVHLRSALSSWALTRNMPLHTFGERPALHANTSACGDCNFLRLQSDENYVNTDLNVLNFERFKWGGVRHGWLLYCLMDLELLLQERGDNTSPFEVTAEDQAILAKLLGASQSGDPNDSARSLEKKWKEVLPSSKQERDALLEIWAAAGILVPGDTPRKRKGGSNDFVFAATWQGDDGYHTENVLEYFGPYLPQTNH